MSLSQVLRLKTGNLLQPPPPSPLTRTPTNQPTTALNRAGWKESLDVSGTVTSA